MNEKTKNLVFMGVNAALVCVATLIIRIPSTMGYKNFGDVFVIFAAMFFGPLNGAVAGGIGAGLADIIAGYASYAPFTIVIKALEGLIAGYLFRLLSRMRFQYHASVIVSAIPAALVMAGGYFFTNYLFLNGEIAAALSDLVGDLFQGAIGVVGGVALIFVLSKTPSIETVCGSTSIMLYRRYASRGISHKKAIVVSDLSGLGRCSLAAQNTIIAASGHEPICLPTAVLSAQTGFNGYRMIPTQQALNEFPAHYDELGLLPDCVLTGFFTDKTQIEKVSALAEKYYDKGCPVIVDPILGDEGKLYNGFDDEYVNAMRSLLQNASIVTPNLTEACLITKESYEKFCSISDKKELFEAVFALAQKIADYSYSSQQNPQRKVIVTGVKCGKRVYNFVLDGEKRKVIGSTYRGTSYSGTGDIFSAVIAGSLLNGKKLSYGARMASRLISHAIADTEIENTPPTEGINYQKFLYLL